MPKNKPNDEKNAGNPGKQSPGKQQSEDSSRSASGSNQSKGTNPSKQGSNVDSETDRSRTEPERADQSTRQGKGREAVAPEGLDVDETAEEGTER